MIVSSSVRTPPRGSVLGVSSLAVGGLAILVLSRTAGLATGDAASATGTGVVAALAGAVAAAAVGLAIALAPGEPAAAPFATGALLGFGAAGVAAGTLPALACVGLLWFAAALAGAVPAAGAAGFFSDVLDAAAAGTEVGVGVATLAGVFSGFAVAVFDPPVGAG